VIVGSRRDVDLRVSDAEHVNFVLGSFVGEDHTQPSLVFGRGAVGRVVHLEAEPRSFGQFLGKAFRITEAAVSGHISRKEAHPFVFNLTCIARSKREDQNMVNHIRSGGANLDRFHPFVFGELGFHDNILIRHCAVGFNRNRLGKLVNRVGLAN
jgi:hypothetical protein